MAEHLLEKLQMYGRSDWYPLHMPGHKRSVSHFGDPFSIDITEIEGFDNLHRPQGVLAEAQARAAALYGADETYYLVNGSSCGILAAVAASVKRGGRILMARNCHKSVYHAVYLNGLHASYLYPPADTRRGINGSILCEAVEEALARHPDTEAVLITSPTYDGVVSDIEAIAGAVHRAGAVLIVDEAHGAHFVMHSYFPKSALACGADLVVNSLHKTLPSLTQTALLHVRGRRADREKLRRYLGIYQSSSPSYVLMAGMDACIGWMEKDGKEMFGCFVRRLEALRESLQGMEALHLVSGRERELPAYDYDRSKVLISTERCRIGGPALSRKLRQFHLEPEMEAARYVTAILTACDTKEGFDRFRDALLAVDSGLAQEAAEEMETSPLREEAAEGIKSSPPQGAEAEETETPLLRNEEALTMEEAQNAPLERMALESSAGRVSGEFVYLYPPGIPLIVPGERIADALARQFLRCRAIGMELEGLSDHSGRTILVVKEDSYG